MPRALIIAALAGIVSGVVFVAPMYESVLGIMFINFTHLPLFLAGLGLGTPAIGVAALTGTMVVGAAKGFGPLLWRTADDGSMAWYPPGRLLTILICYATGVFALFYMVMGNDGPGMIESMRVMLDHMFTIMAPTMPADERLMAAGSWAPYIPAALVVSWLITVTFNGALAQVMLRRAGRNVRPSLDFSTTELPLPFAFALVASGGLWYFTDGVPEFFGLTLTIIIALAYLFVGLTVVHQVSRGWPLRPFVLIVFYLMLVFFLGWPGLALVAAVGLADQLFGLRLRLAGAAPDKEDE